MEEETTSTAPQGEMSSGSVPKPEMGATSGTGEMSGTTTTPHTESLDDIKKELEATRTALKKANTESAGHRKKADELDKLKADQEAATLSEQQKLQKERDKLQAERDQLAQSLKETKIQHTVSLQAQKLGFADPSDAGFYIDESQLNEDLSNVDDLLKAVLKAKPYLAGKTAQPTSGGPTNPSRTQSANQPITREYVHQIQAGGQQAWSALSLDEQRRISAFIRQGGTFKH